MKKIFLILIFANFIGLNQIALSGDPPCGGPFCSPWINESRTFALSDCPDCSVSVIFIIAQVVRITILGQSPILQKNVPIAQ